MATDIVWDRAKLLVCLFQNCAGSTLPRTGELQIPRGCVPFFPSPIIYYIDVGEIKKAVNKMTGRTAARQNNHAVNTEFLVYYKLRVNLATNTVKIKAAGQTAYN